MSELIAEEFGVRLTFKDVPATKSSGKSGAHWRLTTLRPNAARVFADHAKALLAFQREVAASKRDPIVARLVGGEHKSWT